MVTQVISLSPSDSRYFEMRIHSLLIIAAAVLLLASCAAPVVTPAASSTVVAPATVAAAAPPTTASDADPCTTTAKSYQPGMLPPGRIAFQCFTEAKAINLYVFDTATGKITNLTHDTSANTDIQWSPDGQQIAFHSNRADHPGTYVMNADGSQAKWLFDGSIARWSPDGKHLAFAHNGGLYVITNTEQLPTRLADNLGAGGQKSWSPDSGQLAFAAKPSGIHAIRLDGTHETTLTDYPNDYGDIVWSPDGAAIDFLSSPDGPFELYQVTPRGDQPTRLAAAPADIDFFALSPDGKKIVVHDGDGTVSVMNSDGSQKRPLLDSPTNHLSWSPDGQYLAFAYDEVTAVKVETGQIITLTDSSATIEYPAWSPQ